MTKKLQHLTSRARTLTHFPETLHQLMTHPIGRKDRIGTLSRFLRWQIGSRLLRQAVAVPYVNGTRLILRTGMHGMTMNLYVGLHEFEDMMFVAHLLREDDQFIDVGANAGEYSILAASCGAKVLALEPVSATYEQLLDNIYLNRFHEQIDARNIGIGSERGELRFSTGSGPTNHVLTAGESGVLAQSVTVDVLDNVAGDWSPIMVKIDVEGFEANVIKGAKSLLARPSLQAVLIELNGLGARYGFNDADIHSRLLNMGFCLVEYNPFSHQLIRRDEYGRSGNSLYVREPPALECRLHEAQSVEVVRISV